MKRVQWSVVMAAALLLTACGGGGETAVAMAPKQTTDAAPTSTATGASRVVVAVIDSAINPYHEAFYAGGSLYPGTSPRAVTSAVLAEFGIDAGHILTLTRTGNFAADVAADAAQWSKVKRGERYWVRGTNLILVSFDDSGLPLLQPAADKDPHGVGTSSAVLAAAPQSVLVFVEGTVPDAEAFAFTHPAVDIVSTSYGTSGSIPFASQPLAQSLEGVVMRGKLHVVPVKLALKRLLAMRAYMRDHFDFLGIRTPERRAAATPLLRAVRGAGQYLKRPAFAPQFAPLARKAALEAPTAVAR